MTWKSAALEEVLDLADPGVWGSKDAENGVRVLRSTNFRDDGSLDLSTPALRSVPASKRCQKTLARGDIILERSGGSPAQPVGRVCYFDGAEEPHLFGSFCQRLRSNQKLVHRRFLFWYLYHLHRLGGTLPLQKQTTGIRNLDFRAYLRHPVPLPPLSEQRRIAGILDRITRLRRLRTEADAKTARILPALFLKMFGDPITNPNGWPIKRFDEICESRLGKMLDAKQQTGSHSRFYLRNANVHWDRLALDDLLQMDFDEEDRQEFRLQPGDVLICEGGEVGRAAIWNGELTECYYQKALHRARPFAHASVPEYIVYVLSELARRGALREAASGATFSHLTGVKLKALRIPVPPLGLQQLFGRRVRFFKQNDASSASAARLNRLFKTVRHRAFSGRLTDGGEGTGCQETLFELLKSTAHPTESRT